MPDHEVPVVTARLTGGPYSGIVVVLEPGTLRYRIGDQGWEPSDPARPVGEYVFAGIVEYGYARYDWEPAPALTPEQFQASDGGGWPVAVDPRTWGAQNASDRHP